MSVAAFLFPGQGAQFVGMAKQLHATLPDVQALFRQAEQVLGYDLLALCTEGPVEKLNTTVISQPAIFVSSLAALLALKTSQPDIAKECVATAGLSLGEYTALVFSDALSLEAGLRVVQCRGEAMQSAAEATPSGMAAVLTLEPAQVVDLVAQAQSVGSLQIANYLSPGNIVVSGVLPALDKLCQLVEQAGAKAVRLAVAGAFHTPLMKPADRKLADALSKVELRSPRVPVWSNVDAKPHTDPQEIRDLLVRQVVEPVLWEATMKGMLAGGVDKFYEIGPGRVLAGLLKRVHRKAEIVNIQA